jgi:hypothetical protein
MLSIRRKFEGKRIFCAIDRLESLKIVPLKYWLERFQAMPRMDWQGGAHSSRYSSL